MLWLVLFFLTPGYVVVCLALGTVDPVFGTPVPAWSPLDWSFDTVGVVLSHVVGPDPFVGRAVLRTLAYVALAVIGCVLIGFPVAYFAARHAGRRRLLVLVLLLSPFWISYMMRMLAWVNLLQDDGLVNRLVTLGGLLPTEVNWLDGRSTTVVAGLVYGYVPYMILPLYVALDRISPSLLEAGRDLGASSFETFRRVVLPMSTPGLIAGGLLVGLPMLGDYFTNDLLSGSPQTAMLGNLINLAVSSPNQTGQGGALVLLLILVLLLPMVLYVRHSTRPSDVRS
jgi:spermidine/putrescine transport system permease protein